MENEKRLIDANKIQYHKSGFPKGEGFDSGLDWAFREDIDKLPTVEAVEVVRCKDCKKGHPELAPNGGVWCAKWNHVFGDDGFCSYGERKDNG